MRLRADVLRRQLPKVAGDTLAWWQGRLADTRLLAAANPNLLSEVVNNVALAQLECETLALVAPPTAESFLMDVPAGIPCS